MVIKICYKSKKVSIFIIFFIIIVLNTQNLFAFNLELNSNLLNLVNRDNTVSNLYIPTDLKNVSDFMPTTKKEVLLREDAYDALKLMYEDLKKEGIYLNAVSGYRSYQYQQNLFQKEVEKQQSLVNSKEEAIEIAKTMTATPGSSEHQLGLAIDFSESYLLTEDFENTPAGKWLQQNSHKYGFILRYPKDKINITKIIYEPWHFRYVGIPHSVYMTENNLTLEEYIEKLKIEKHIVKIYNNTKYEIFYTNDPLSEFKNIIDISYDNSGGYIITTETKLSSMLMTVSSAYFKNYVFI